MDGYKFEELVNILFKKMDFDTELTSKSGDGGVDIIARYNKPVFKGDYLIQCKYWENQVGEPSIRDLYGICLSEKANKGILITNSGFTNNAVSFSEGKNLELIDGDILHQLMDKYDVDYDNVTNYVSGKTHFTEQENFEVNKYNYLKAKIRNEPREPNHYLKLRNFFIENLISKNWAVIKNGLLDEFISINEEYAKRFVKNTKSGVVEKKALKFWNGMLYLYKGELLKAVEIFSDLDLFNDCDVALIMPHVINAIDMKIDRKTNQIIVTCIWQVRNV